MQEIRNFPKSNIKCPHCQHDYASHYNTEVGSRTCSQSVYDHRPLGRTSICLCNKTRSDLLKDFRRAAKVKFQDELKYAKVTDESKKADETGTSAG